MHDLVREVLSFDPDNDTIRKALGQVRIEGATLAPIRVPENSGRRIDVHDYPPPEELFKGVTNGSPTQALLPHMDIDANWYTLFMARHIRKGLSWDDKSGWIIAKYRDRYEKGAIFDFQRHRWTSRAEANAFHSKLSHPWHIETEHLSLHGTVDLRVLADAATKLEAFYRRIFAVYADFFIESRRVDAFRLVLGLAKHPRLKVYVYRDMDQYLSMSDAERWTAGVFKPNKKASYFIGEIDLVMYHEFTHQIFHVFTGKNKGPAWLTEGVAVYTQNPVMVNDRMTLRGAPFDDNMRLEKLFGLRTYKAWYREAKREDRATGSRYAAAGSLVTFCMDGEDGRYRADFIDFLRDSYRGTNRRRKVWEYLDLSYREFAERYSAFGRGP